MSNLDILAEGKSASAIWNDPEVLDHSCLACAGNCLREAFWRYLLCLKPVGRRPAYEFGGSIHVGTEFIRGNKTIVLKSPAGNGVSTQSAPLTTLEGAQRAFTKKWESYGGTPDGEKKRTIEVGHELLAQYSEWWTASPYELVYLGSKPMNEIGFACEYSPNLTVTGRIDAIIKHKELGSQYVLDDKTSSVLSTNYWQDFRLTAQASCYCLAATQLDIPVDGFMARVLWVSSEVVSRTVYKGTKREARRPGKIAIHGNTYPRSPESLYQHMNDFIYWAGVIADLVKFSKDLPLKTAWQLWPKSTNACITKYHTCCPYMDLCQYGPVDAPISERFKIEPWEPWEIEKAKEAKNA